MRFSSALFLLASISQVLGMVAFNNAHYANGVLTFTTTTWTDAPQSYNIAIVDANGQATTILANVPSTPGSYSLQLPSIPAGTYRIQAQSTDGSQVYTTTSGFSVASGDINSSVTAASYAVVSTGTVRPLVTTSAVVVSGSTSIGTFTLTAPGTAAAATNSASVSSQSGVETTTATFTTGTTTSVSPVATTSLFTTETVFTSGSLTTTFFSTGSITATVTPASSSGAATATTVATTTRNAGLKSAGVSFGLPVVAGLVLGAFLL